MATYDVTAPGSSAVAGSTASPDRLVPADGASSAVFASMASYERLAEASGTSSVVATSTAAPAREADAVGASSAAASGSALASLLTEAIGASAAVFTGTARYDGEESHTWVTFAETGFVGRYTNYEFNSFATIGDRSFAFGDKGIVEIGGAADDGAPIDLFLLGGTDRKDLGIRRPHIGYVVGLVPDNANLFVVDDEGAVFDYPLAPTEGRLETVRAKVGKGIRARHLRYGVFAKATEPMEISTMTIYLADLTRNV